MADDSVALWGFGADSFIEVGSALEADPACSLACIQFSGVLLSGSLLVLLSPSLWWVDGVAALALALLIAREGIGMVRAARHPEFKGGCGCH